MWGWDSSLSDLPLCPCCCPLALIWLLETIRGESWNEKVEIEKRNLKKWGAFFLGSRCSKRRGVCYTLVRKVQTWQVVKGLMLQSNCETSWMDTWRLNAFPLNSMVLGSSSSRPPLPRSPTATSWWQTDSDGWLVSEEVGEAEMKRLKHITTF